MFDGLTLAEYLAPRMKKEKQKKERRITKRKIVEQSYLDGNKLIVCALLANCCERYARRVISKYKKAAAG